MRTNIKTAYMAMLAIIVWVALIIQFYISTEKYLSQGRSFGGAIIQLLSYFTIQNNFLVALAMTLFLLAPQSKWAKWFAKPGVLASMCVYITIVLLVYQLVLRGQHLQLGWFRFCDEILHSISPPMFVLFWLLFVPRANIAWGKAINWLLFPLLYCFYILIRGAISNYYPYSFIDGTKLTYGEITINCFFLLLAFLSVGLLFIGTTRIAKKG
jgi:hypothetical protein